MSYDDPNRNSLGEYHSLGIPVNPGEQWAAGVNPYDNVFSAALKVRNQRVAMGLDEFTGLPPLKPGYVGHYAEGAGGRGAGSAGTGWFGNALWAVMKWLVLVPGIACGLLLGALVAAAYANLVWRESGPGRGLAAVVAAEVAPGAHLAPPSTYLSPKLLDAARALDPLWAPPPRAKLLPSFFAWGYLCELDAACARGAEALPRVYAMNRAELFLIGEAKRGSESAARDACLLPLLAGASRQPVWAAWEACSVAARDSRSGVARALTAALASSWTAKFARATEWAGDVACLGAPEAACRLSDAPEKISTVASRLWKGAFDL